VTNKAIIGRRKRKMREDAPVSCATRLPRPRCWKSPKSTKLWPNLPAAAKPAVTVMLDRPPESKSDSLERFGRPGVPAYQPRAKSTPRAEKRPWRTERVASARINRLVRCCGSGSAASRPGAVARSRDFRGHGSLGPHLTSANATLTLYRDIGTRIGGSYWLNTAYPGFEVGDDPGAPIVTGASFAVGAVVAAGFAGRVAAAFGSAAGVGTAVAAGCLEHAAATPRSSAMAKRLLISPPILIP
jgi:hypothetical protein